MEPRTIYFTTGMGLLALAAISGIFLLVGAVKSKGQQANWDVATLWGLFLIGLIAGLILIAVSTTK